MDNFSLLIIFLSLLFSAFFSGSEIAFLQSNKLQIELEKKKGHFNARVLSYFVSNQNKFITSLLLGNNIALVIYGIFMGELIIKLIFPKYEGFMDFPIQVLLLQTVISTLIILITAEFLPKTIFRINPNKTLSFLAFPLIVIYIILYPLTVITSYITSLFFRLLKHDEKTEEINFGRVDLDNYLEQSTKKTESVEDIEHEVQIFKNALNFSKLKIRDCMIPRPEIIAVNIEENIKKLKEEFINTSLSKILVYRDSIDNIIGYVHSFEMFKSPESIKSILRPVSIFPESITADKTLEEFIRQNRSIGVVVDEFGGTSGIITIEDIVEEIFGEIEDEHDVEEIHEEQLSDNEFIFSARMEIEQINQKYDLKLPEADEYETLAGYVINEHESIPSEKEIIIVEPYTFEILEASDSRIELIKLTIDKNTKQ